MSPLEIYQSLLNSGQYKKDPMQLTAIQALQRIYDQLSHAQSVTQKIKNIFSKRSQIKGLYLWGSVGIGKTWLMDIFVKSLGEQKKLRMHFHSFMRMTHQQLTRYQGKKDPLQLIAKNLAKRCNVLCFDEFFVTDIVDAMLLGNLFRALWSAGIMVVATANVHPDDLYKNGLQRELFLPAIALIKMHCVILHMRSQQDYRLQTLQQEGIYYYPLTQETHAKMQKRFAHHASTWTQGEMLTIEKRQIPTVRIAANTVWFTFQDLCTVPRSQMDYLEIARMFHTVFLSNVPKISRDQDNAIQYLINLVDVFYDAHVKLIIAAEVSVDELYSEGRMQFVFQRTKSRLREMQSIEYWRKSHCY